MAGPAPGAQNEHDRVTHAASHESARAQHVPNVERSIAQALAIKDGEVFLVCDRHGDVPLAGKHGYGLYYHDCRYLSGYALHIGNEALIPLSAADRGGYMAVFRLTNRDMVLPDGTALPKQSIGIEWSRIIKGTANMLQDTLVVQNYGRTSLTLPLRIGLAAAFDDIFEVRSLSRPDRNLPSTPIWHDNMLHFRYQGTDKVLRLLRVHFSLSPTRRDRNGATFELVLPPQAKIELTVELMLAEDGADVLPLPVGEPAIAIREVLATASEAWLAQQMKVTSNSILLGRVMTRSLADLHALGTPFGDDHFFAAGIPWYATLFGRDSLVTALQMLAYLPAVGEQTLRLLASLQGRVEDPFRDEQPGKILHEFRQGELATLGEVPFGRYYGSVDATPLFLVLLVEHARWTGSLVLFEELRPHVERALAWIASARDATGFLTYSPGSGRGLVNQGWKDSDDAIIDLFGAVATPPIALAEVQGYLYRAFVGLAELFERAGDAGRAKTLTNQADKLRAAFERHFWMPEVGFYALARHGDGELAGAIASNAGQALWTGIVSQRHATKIVHRLLAPDMYSGWGVRTLSDTSPRYNPLGYHLGTVWPHDNWLIMAGMRAYGEDEAAIKVFMGIFDAATSFPEYRLPELFSGFVREADDEPVSYPVACHPQAWAAGAVPAMLVTLLGLVPDGFNNSLRIERPLLPPFVDRLEVHGLHVGRGCVSLRFERSGGGVGVSVLARTGGLEVVVEPG